MLRMPLHFMFTFIASTDPKASPTILNLRWTDYFSFNKLVTIGMIQKFIKKGVLKDTGHYVIQMDKIGWLKYQGVIYHAK